MKHITHLIIVVNMRSFDGYKMSNLPVEIDTGACQ